MSATQPQPAPDPADLLAEEHRLALKLLREKGMDIAMRLHAASEDPEADLGEIATKFARVARAVRQTIVLESRLADEDQIRRREAEALAAQRAVQLRRELGRHQTLQVMAAAAPIFAASELKTLDEHFAYRLERLDDRDPDFPNRPVEAVIAEICTALGVPLPSRERVAPQGSGEGAHRPVHCDPPPTPVPVSEPPHPSTASTPSPASGEGSSFGIPPPDLRTLVNWGGPAPDTG